MHSNNTDNKQVENKTVRQLNHLPDMTSGVSYTPIPLKLIRAYIDKKIPEAKFKLQCVMLTHDRDFKIWSTYLRKRFDQRTLSKYTKELVAEGYIRVEEARTVVEKNGKKRKVNVNVYHVNSVHEWQIYQGIEVGAPSNLRVQEHGVEEHGVAVHDISKSTASKLTLSSDSDTTTTNPNDSLNNQTDGNKKLSLKDVDPSVIQEFGEEEVKRAMSQNEFQASEKLRRFLYDLKMENKKKREKSNCPPSAPKKFFKVPTSIELGRAEKGYAGLRAYLGDTIHGKLWYDGLDDRNECLDELIRQERELGPGIVDYIKKASEIDSKITLRQATFDLSNILEYVEYRHPDNLTEFKKTLEITKKRHEKEVQNGTAGLAYS